MCFNYTTDLLHNGVNVLWFWEVWIGISAWWLCWTCWRNHTVLFRRSISVLLPFCRWVFPIDRWDLYRVNLLISFCFEVDLFSYLAMCSFQFILQSNCSLKYFTTSVWGMIVWLVLTAGQRTRYKIITLPPKLEDLLIESFKSCAWKLRNM